MSPRGRPEQAIHRAVVAHLKARAVPGLFWFHVPSGAFFGGRHQGAIMKSLGWMAGLPDIIAIKRGKPYALELKVEGGKLSLAQEACLIRLRECGVTATHAHGLDQAIRVLEMWGLLSGKTQ
jgi:hypothetical protein